MDYSQLLGFPVEIVALAIVCFTVLEIVKQIVNRKKDKIELTKKE